VTDADLCLGYLDQNYFLGGKMKLDREASQKAIDERLARPLGVTSIEATWGIHDLINETMAGAAKTHIAEKGGNPKIVTICAFGGAGPVHAYGLARKLGAPAVIVPPFAGVGSALGFFTAPRAFDLVRSHKVGLADADLARIEALFRDMEEEGRKVLGKSGAEEEIGFERSVDMRFVGQGSETNVAVPAGDFSKKNRSDIRKLFDEKYEILYGRTYLESPAEFVSFKVRASLPQRTLTMHRLEKKGGRLEDALKGERPAYSPLARDYITFKVYDRYSLTSGATLPGPAIIEERESTAVVGEDARVEVDAYGFLWIRFEG